jgi:hypothetical protein
MQVYADAHVRLEALGLEDEVSPLVLQAFCQRCDQLLHERIYRAEQTATDLVVAVHAEADALRALAHVLGRNIFRPYKGRMIMRPYSGFETGDLTMFEPFWTLVGLFAVTAFGCFCLGLGTAFHLSKPRFDVWEQRKDHDWQHGRDRGEAHDGALRHLRWLPDEREE